MIDYILNLQVFWLLCLIFTPIIILFLLVVWLDRPEKARSQYHLWTRELYRILIAAKGEKKND
jgi:hypothetical protein